MRPENKFKQIMRNAGLHPMTPEGGFFIIGNITMVKGFQNEFPAEETPLLKTGQVDVDPTTLNRRDYNYCRWLSFAQGVTAIPTSAFYSQEHANLGYNNARFAFCKADAVLHAAGQRILHHK